jgi:hypothetical protein
VGKLLDFKCESKIGPRSSEDAQGKKQQCKEKKDKGKENTSKGTEDNAKQKDATKEKNPILC